nr:hypothetical protein B11C_110333 [Bartonella sp. 1-1C]
MRKVHVDLKILYLKVLKLYRKIMTGIENTFNTNILQKSTAVKLWYL